MAVSFNNKYLALFTDTGLLWIGSSDLQKVYCEFDTKCPTRPQQLVWYVSSLYGISINVVLIIVMGCNFPSKRIQCQKPRPVVLLLANLQFHLDLFQQVWYRCHCWLLGEHLADGWPTEGLGQVSLQWKVDKCNSFQINVKHVIHVRCNCWRIY